MFKCRCCGLQKEDNYCCEADQGICLDCCEDRCPDSLEELFGFKGFDIRDLFKIRDAQEMLRPYNLEDQEVVIAVNKAIEEKAKNENIKT